MTKIRKALSTSAVGAYPATVATLLGYVPAGVVSALSSRQLAELLDAMSSLARDSKAAAERDACTEGALWDASTSRLLQIEARP